MDDFASNTNQRRIDTLTRRRTTSNPFPAFEDSFTAQAEHETETVPVSAEHITAHAPPRHRRTFSGNLLARLSFLRSNSENDRPSSRDGQPPKSPKSTKSRVSIDDDIPITSPVSPPLEEGSMAQVFKASQSRKRKGSLRKTALLGGRRLLAEGRERRNSLLQRTPTTRLVSRSSTHPPDPDSSPETPPADSDVSLQIPSGDTSGLHRRRHDGQGAEEYRFSEPAITTGRHTSLPQPRKTSIGREDVLGGPDTKSVTSTSYASTTDEDDMTTFDHLNHSYQSADGLGPVKPLSSAATSYFPSTSEASLPLRSVSTHKRSPLSHTISSSSLYPPSTSDAGHDYTETEYWGWVILFVTWLTFTVGMGSCLEIWSWAWDVGETPYAPPELEDDPTLPIVGYYPALIVLTGVVAWVWITVAWVGMKYFKHAKIEV